MPNTFLGFPVSRARVADIALTTLDNQGGGGGFIAISQVPEYPASYFQTVTGTGSVSQDTEGIWLRTNNTLGGTSRLRRGMQPVAGLMDWDHQREFSILADLRAETSKNGLYWAVMGDWAGSLHVGFRIQAGKLYAAWRGSSVYNSQEIQTLGTGAWSTVKHLKAILFPATKIEFYVDGVLVYTATTDLPTGTTAAEMVLDAYVDNQSWNEHKYFWVCLWGFKQLP